MINEHVDLDGMSHIVKCYNNDVCKQINNLELTVLKKARYLWATLYKQ